MRARNINRSFAILASSVLAAFSFSCGRAEMESLPTAENNNPADLDVLLALSDRSQQVRVLADTAFKTSTAQSSSLPEKERCALKKGQIFVAKRVVQAATGHVEVSLAEGLKGCSFSDGFLFRSHVEFSDVFIAKAIGETLFKSEVTQGSALSATEKCVIPAGKMLYMTKPAADAGQQHYRIEIPDWELASCSFGKGFIFAPHFSHVDRDVASAGGGFESVMKHILLWEGGCSDVPQDTGGRTYMGITSSVARRNGWAGDVCRMPKSMVLSIYRKDYWEMRAYRYGWPLNLAVMNTEVNSGGGRAQQFLERMERWGVSGSLREQASWFVDQQTDFYRRIVDSNPSQRIFLRGWLNRSNYMQDVIAGDQGLSLVGTPAEPTAKAYFEGE